MSNSVTAGGPLSLPQLQALLRLRGASRSVAIHLLEPAAAVGPASAAIAADHLPPGRWALVCDAVTRAIAGQLVADAIGAAEVIDVGPRTPGTLPVAGQDECLAVAARLRAAGADAAIAVGSGTVNDLAKAACHRLGIPYAVVATAPSMNGYASRHAALLAGCVKVTVPCTPPVACVAPAAVLSAAPRRMAAAGLADLRSRAVGCADWYLSDALLGTGYSAAAIDLVTEAERVSAGVAAGLAAGDGDAVCRLVAALLLSGLAMDVAGTSAPSSGGEHLVSHYLDMSHHAFGTPCDLHGCQVGVATLVCARLYQRLLALDPRDFGGAARADRRPWALAREPLARHFGDLWPSLEDTARRVYGGSDEVAARLALLADRWTETAVALGSILRSPEALRAELVAAGAPVTFAGLGVDAALARAALLHARFVRSRYTILDLAAELGTLEAWVDDALEATAA